MTLLLAAALALASTPAGAQALLSKDSKAAQEAKAVPVSSTATYAEMLRAADAYRKEALHDAARKLAKLKTQVASGAKPSDFDADTVKFVSSWLYAFPTDADYADTLTTALDAIARNRAIEPPYTVFPDSRKFCDYSKEKAKGKAANAYNLKGDIYLCEPWIKGSAECRRVVVIHEVFHTVGLVDLDTKLKFPARTTAQALSDAAYMAGLASQLHSGHEDSCP